jgi:hypothetical protein
LAGLEPGQHGYCNEGDRAESGDQLSDEDESDEDEITHAVPFKLCIGAAHEKNYQHNLEQAYLALHGQDKPVNVRIRPEPLNPMDPYNWMDTYWLYCFSTMKVFAPTNCHRRYLRGLCSAYQV